MNDLKQTTCKRCGRKLKSPEAIELGMGATCWAKFKKTNHRKLFDRKENEK